MLRLLIVNILDREERIMDEWMKTSLIDIVELIGGGTPKTSKAEYWGGNINWYQLKILTMRTGTFILQKKLLQKKGLIIAQQNY